MRRKTRIALTVSLLSAAAALGASLAVQAANGVPDKATFAPQLAGDAGEYRLTVLDKHGRQVSDELAFRFQWLPAQQARDAHGVPHLTHPVRIEQPTPDGPRLTTYYLDPSDPGADIQTIATEGSIEETVLLPIAPGLGSSTASASLEVVGLANPGSGGLAGLECVLLPRLAGRSVDLGRDVDLFAPCAAPAQTPRFLFAPSFRAIRAAELGGRDVLVFQGQDHWLYQTRADAKGVWAWVDPDIPYPLQVAQDDGGLTYIHRLASFVRGDAPLQVDLPADGQPLPPLVLADRQPWGMDDAGVEHPWPLSAAWMHARDDPLAPAMRDWLAAHPNAYTGHAQGRIVDVGSTRDIEWQWVLADGEGRDTLTVGITRQSSLAPALPGPLSGLVPATTTLRYTYDNRSLTREPEAFPAWDQLVHKQLPTAASLELHWRAHAAAGAGLDSWKFTDACYSNTCASQESEQSLGSHHWTGQAVGGGPASVVSGWDVDYDLFRRWQPFGDDFAGTSFISIWRVQTEANDLTVAGVPLEGKPAQAPTGITVAANAWQASDPAGIVAVGVLAALVFVVVRFAGVLGLPLFSRIESGKVLDHPLRKMLHDAIQANPGIHRKALARTVGRPRNTVEHHVRRLVQAGVVVEHPLNGYACLFAKGQVDRREQAAAGALKSDASRRVLAAVVREPGASGRSLAAASGLSPTLVSYHVANLREAGLVEQRRDGRTVRVLPTDLGQRVAAAP